MVILALLPFIGIAKTVAEHPAELFRNARFQNYNMQNGLPSDNCFRILQAPDNAIWISTLHGVARFNGYRWLYFQQEAQRKEQRISSNWAMDMSACNGLIWINTDRGVSSVSSRKFTTSTAHLLHRGWGRIIVIPGAAYLSTWQGIVHYSVKKGKFSDPHLIPGTANQSYLQLFADSEHSVFGIQEDPACFFELRDRKIIRHETVRIGRTKKNIEAVCLAKQGNALFVGTERHGILRYFPASGKAFVAVTEERLKHLDLAVLQPYSIYGRTLLLIGTKGQGLYVFDPMTDELICILPQPEKPETSLSSSIIHDIFVDSYRGIWIATNKGVSYFHPGNQRFKTYFFYRHPVIPENTTINAIQPVSGRQYLIGTASHGLFLYDLSNGKGRAFPLKATISSICKKTENSYLIGTEKGIFLLQLPSGNLQPWSDIRTSVLTLRTLPGNRIGAGTSTGGYLLDDHTGKILFQESLRPGYSDSYRFTKDLLIDRQNRLWLLRFFDGIDCIDLKTGTYIHLAPHLNGTPGVDYHNFTSDSVTGRLFVASTVGLLVADMRHPKQLTMYNSASGLAGDIVERCIFDNRTRQLFYTTPVGLYRFDMVKQHSFLLHRIEQYQQKWFNDLRIDKRSLLLTVSDHFAHYSIPEAIYSTPVKPLIDAIYLDHKLLQTPSSKTVIQNDRHSLDIRFSRPDYALNHEQILQYRLHPFNTEWKYVSGGKIELLGLHPGEYTLQVRTRNLATGQNSRYLLHTIHVDAPFYTTWWFYALLTLLISGVVYLIFWFRNRSRERLIQTRMQLSRDLHDELGANISSINVMASMLQTTAEPNSKQWTFVQNIVTYSRQINETINDIIWNVNPRFDTIPDLVQRMTRYASETLDGTNARYTIDVPEQFPQTGISHLIKHHSYLLFKEAINNCVKYSNASNVLIRFYITQNRFGFEIHDNGIGFDPEKKQSCGNGIFNMYKRAETVRGQLEIRSTPGEGTHILFNKSV